MQTRSLLATLALLVSSLSLLAAPGASGAAIEAAERPRGVRAEIVEVEDGDSIRVRILRTGAPRNIRLIGIDTPEIHGQVECGGPEGARSLTRMLPVGKIVRLRRDRYQDNRDLFNRYLRYVITPKGVDVGRRQLHRGWAQVFVFGGETYKRIDSYRRASKRAKRADRGVWSHC
jgi:endonuclease YncB( thermonuclease family)